MMDFKTLQLICLIKKNDKMKNFTRKLESTLKN